MGTSYDNKSSNSTECMTVQWIFIHHNNGHNNNAPQVKSRATPRVPRGGIISVTNGGFTSLLLVLGQVLSITPKQSPVMLQNSLSMVTIPGILDN
jgi:hypothetical protein